jgi:hypothetical protein
VAWSVVVVVVVGDEVVATVVGVGSNAVCGEWFVWLYVAVASSTQVCRMEIVSSSSSFHEFELLQLILLSHYDS